MTEHQPPLGRDLAGVQIPFAWKLGEARAGASVPASVLGQAEGESEVDRLRAQVRQLTSALEDIVTFALSNADYKERAIMMHRRAAAALTGMESRQPPRP